MKKKTKELYREQDDEPLSLDMSFDEALEMLLNTPPPTDQDEEEQHQQERNENGD